MKHQFADKIHVLHVNEKNVAVDNSQLCWSFITRKLCIGSEKLHKLCLQVIICKGAAPN